MHVHNQFFLKHDIMKNSSKTNENKNLTKTKAKTKTVLAYCYKDLGEKDKVS